MIALTQTNAPRAVKLEQIVTFLNGQIGQTQAQDPSAAPFCFLVGHFIF